MSGYSPSDFHAFNVQTTDTRGKSVTYRCGQPECTFTIVRSLDGLQPGDRVQFPEITTHDVESHGGIRMHLGGTEINRVRGE